MLIHRLCILVCMHPFADAPPSADLWEDQTDEGELGFTYDFVEVSLERSSLL